MLLRGARRPLRVVVGLSGGVDSAVTALLLQRRGFDVRACFVRSWDAADEDAAAAGGGASAFPFTSSSSSSSSSSSASPPPAAACAQQAADLLSAQLTARRLGVPLAEADFSRAYWLGVFAPFLRELSLARTPNPDAACNRVV